MSKPTPDHELRIWAYAFGYFACYAPYSALTKAVTQGRVPGMSRAIGSFEILPLTTLTSFVGMFIFLTAMGWWKHATHSTVFGRSLPHPGPWTFLSGLCSAAIIATTTLSYALSGVSIVFMMLLMRGGVLVIAPIVDTVSRRKVRWNSWVALGLSLGALLAAVTERASYTLTVVAAIDVAIYLTSYFIRLRFMSHLAKSDDPEQATRYFVEEQMVATPAIVLFLALIALFAPGDSAHDVRRGFTDIAMTGGISSCVIVGLLSQGTGIFGGLILLDKRENTFCVPVNRASSILAGLVATASLTFFFGAKPAPRSELIGAGLIIVAVGVLAIPGILEKRRARALPPPGSG